MLESEISRTICTIYETFGVDFSKPVDYSHPESTFDGMMFVVNAGTSMCNKEKFKDQHDVCADILFILVGGTRMFYKVVNPEDYLMEAYNSVGWKNESNHDSCWRDAIRSVISSVYFKMCKKVQDHLPEEEKLASKDIEFFNTLRMSPIRVSMVKLDDGYHYRLTNVDHRNHTFSVSARGSE